MSRSIFSDVARWNDTLRAEGGGGERQCDGDDAYGALAVEHEDGRRTGNGSSRGKPRRRPAIGGRRRGTVEPGAVV